MSHTVGTITLQEFLTMPESDQRFELVDGRLVAKDRELIPNMSPTTPHSRTQKRLLRLLDDWCEDSGQGEVNPEWTVVLQRQGVVWAPVPDLAYISRSRMPTDWDGEGPCPGIPEVVIEIISPGQTFGDLAEKATDYLLAGVDQVWLVDTKVRSVTRFWQNDLPQTVRDGGIIADPQLPGLELPLSRLFG